MVFLQMMSRGSYSGTPVLNLFPLFPRLFCGKHAETQSVYACFFPIFFVFQSQRKVNHFLVKQLVFIYLIVYFSN